MGRLGVTKEDVFTACGVLLSSGMPITVANVRGELGTGSYSTLSPLIDSFKNSHKENEESKKNSELPDDIADLGSKMLQEIWLESTRIRNKKIEEISTEFSKKNNELSKELMIKTDEYNGAVNDIKKLESEIDSLKIEIQNSEKNAAAKDGEINLLKIQAEQRDIEIKKLIERAAAAERELEIKSKK